MNRIRKCASSERALSERASSIDVCPRNSRRLTASGVMTYHPSTFRRLLASGYYECFFARLFFALVLALFLQSAAIAGVTVGDVIASVQPTPSMIAASGSYGEGTCHGYVEFRVLLKNNSPEERIVYLSYPPSRSIGGGAVVKRTVKIAGKQTVSVSIFQPPLYASSNTLEVRVKDVRDPGVMQVNSSFSYSGYRGYNETSKIAVLLGRAVPQEFADGMKAEKEKPTVGTTTSVPPYTTSAVTTPEERFTYFRSELPVGEWSRNWLGYSCFDVIVLDGGEAESMPPQVSLAVRRWLECGGTLIVNSRTMPEALCNGGRLDSKKRFRVGLGRVILSMRTREKTAGKRRTNCWPARR